MEQKIHNLQYVKLLLLEQCILLPLEQVQMVLPLPALQSVPNQDAAFVGLLNYHGSGVAIFDLAQLITQKALETDLNTPILLCHAGTTQLGLLVSEVIGLETITADTLQTPKSGTALPYVTGFYQHETESAWILDLEKLIAHHRLTLPQEVSHG